MNTSIRQLAAALILALGLAACQAAAPVVTPTPSARPQGALTPGVLTPYYTPTPSRTPTLPAPPPSLEALPVTPAPSATPFTHTVAKGETMLGIAFQYSIGLDVLLAANPDVDPQFLTVGTQLVIPLGGQVAEVQPTATPMAVGWQGPVCHRSADGGAWCFVLAQNEQADGLENLSAWIGLFDGQGQLVAGQVAIGGLNLLLPGGALPLAAYFAPPLPEAFTAQAEPLSALAVTDGNARYLQAEIKELGVDVAAGGGQAVGSGEVWLAGPAPRLVWVEAVAYGAEGQVVGMRKWEAEQPCTGLFPAATPTGAATATLEAISTPNAPVMSPPVVLAFCTRFDLTVYSLGPAIQRVEFLVEARP